MAEVDGAIAPPKAPEVDGDAAFDEPILDTQPPTEIDPSLVRVALEKVGEGVGYFVGDDDVPQHWHFTPKEIDQLVPPVTSIINRTPKLQTALARGDEFVIALVLAGYTGRNLELKYQAVKARKDKDELSGEADANQGASAGAFTTMVTNSGPAGTTGNFGSPTVSGGAHR